MEQQQSSFKEKERTDLREPQHFKVIIYNDDFTTMEFVVKILTTIFFKIDSRSRNADVTGTQESIGSGRHLYIRHCTIESTESHPYGTRREFSTPAHRCAGRRIRIRRRLWIYKIQCM